MTDPNEKYVKVQHTGPNEAQTFIYIPKEWVATLGLEEEVLLCLEQGRIVVFPVKVTRKVPAQ